MSHCLGCANLERQLAEAKQDALRVFREGLASDEALREKLAEAQAETATAYRNMKNYQALMAYANEQNDSLRSCVSDLEAERNTLQATLALAQEWAAAYAALSSGRTARESNRLEVAYNAACERLYEALDVGKEAGDDNRVPDL